MPEAAQLPTVFRFGVFELDLRAGELRKQGLKVKLQERPQQVLAVLLEKPGEVVTREELRQRLWGTDTFVDFDHSVNTAINKLREALGDSAESPRFIETLPRHGYRFIGNVEPSRAVRTPRTTEASHFVSAEPGLSLVPNHLPVDSAPVAEGHPPGTVRDRRERRRWLGVAAVAAMVVFGALLALNVAGLRGRLLSSVGAGHKAPFPKIESIAVLPLENLSGDPQQEYFADGMTEELITDLGKISALRVISRTSVMRYKGTRKPLPEIARELHVDAIVEGTVLHSGNRVRITANLLYAPTDRHLWAQTYERNLGDVLSLQDEVARAIASQIQIKLTPQERVRLASARPVNPEAHRLYLQGRYYFIKRNLPALNKSIRLYQRAIEKDPKCALAYAGLSEIYDVLPVYNYRTVPGEFPRKAKAAALKALQLDSNLAEAHAAVGNVLMFYDWDWPGAERELKRAIELNPNYVVAHQAYAEYLSTIGRQEQAFDEIKRAQELDPVSPVMCAMGGEIYNGARRYDEAIQQCRKALELDSNLPPAHWQLGYAYLSKGMYEEALAEFEEASRLNGSDPTLDRARVYVEAGRRGEAMKLLNRLWQEYKEGKVVPLALAPLYASLGEKKRAIDLVEEAAEQHDPAIPSLKTWRFWDPLRSEPRFQALLRRMNFPP